tara:strand:+ start:6850 stop:7077 length:228 start_codon:yes stop_codon:yes gene_type:complete
MRNSRYPIVGDLIIETCQRTGEQFAGVVYEISRRDAWIQWSSGTPQNYNLRWGYSRININNLRSEYRVIRDGKEI